MLFWILSIPGMHRESLMNNRQGVRIVAYHHRHHHQIVSAMPQSLHYFVGISSYYVSTNLARNAVQWCLFLDVNCCPFLKFLSRHIMIFSNNYPTKVHKNFQNGDEKLKKVNVFMVLSKYLCNFGA